MGYETVEDLDEDNSFLVPQETEEFMADEELLGKKS